MERRLFGDGSIVHSVRISWQKFVILSKQNKSTPQHPCMAYSPTYLLHLVDFYGKCRYCKCTTYVYIYIYIDGMGTRQDLQRSLDFFRGMTLDKQIGRPEKKWMEGSNKNDVKGWQTRMFIPINIHNICIKNTIKKPHEV